MTTKCWINQSNNDYCEGDQPSPLHVEVAQRPDWTYDWNGNAWVQNAGRAAQAQQPAKDAADLAAIKADNALITFANMTPAQVDAYLNANVTDLQSARAALKVLAKIVLLVARQSLK